MLDKYLNTELDQLEYNAAFFEKVLSSVYTDVDVSSVAFLSHYGEPGVATLKNSSADDRHLYGLASYAVTFSVAGEVKTVSILVKTKTSALMLLDMYTQILEQVGLDLPQPVRTYLSIWPEAWQRDVREIEIYKFTQTYPAYKKYLPKFYGSYCDEAAGDYVILEALLPTDILYNRRNTQQSLPSDDLSIVIDGMAELHATFYQQVAGLLAKPMFLKITDMGYLTKFKPVYSCYLSRLVDRKDNFIANRDMQLLQQLMASYDSWSKQLSELPTTLANLDFHLLNFGIRRPENTICIYDWECSNVAPPQWDSIEFIAHATVDVTRDTFFDLMELHRQQLSEYAQVPIDKQQWLVLS